MVYSFTIYTMKDQIWRKMFSTRPHTTDFKILHYHPRAFIEFAKDAGMSDALQDIVITLENGAAKRFVPGGQFDAFVDGVLEKAIQDPEWALDLNKQCFVYGEQLFELGRKIEKMKLEDVDTDAFITLHAEFLHLQEKTHFVAYPLARIEAYDQRFSKLLKTKLASKVSVVGAELEELFVTLTTPSLFSVEQKEKLALLRIARSNALGEDVNELLEEHYETWKWLGYGYVGPSYKKDFFETRIEKYTKDAQLDEKIKLLENRVVDISKQIEELYTKHEVSAEVRSLLRLAQSFVITKNFAKARTYYACYILDILHAEVAKRTSFPITHVNVMLPQEVEQVLRGGGLDFSVEDRLDFSLITRDGVYAGDEAKEMYADMKFEEPKGYTELSGSCAYPGVVSGKVKVVRDVDDLSAVEEGDILVAHTTFPRFLPAMQRAAAIVSESGGLTCHSSIVARELKKPTLVGVRYALHNLQDGDMVEVDSTNGIIIKK